MKFPQLIGTALDVGGACVGAFGMNIRDGAPASLQGREPKEVESGAGSKQAAFVVLLIAVHFSMLVSASKLAY
jgi:hypothetical protein